MWLEMKVKGLALDPLSNMPIIVLRDDEEKRSLPIWVGLFEANAIALELEKITTARHGGGRDDRPGAGRSKSATERADPRDRRARRL